MDNFLQDDPFGLRRNFMGFDIVEHTPLLKQKIELSANLQCTDSFRAEFNAWLLDRFGTVEHSLLPPNAAYMFGNTLVMRPEMCAMLHSACA